MSVGARDMSGRTCVITGATSGIGLACAHALAERGAELVLVCRDPERARSLANALSRKGAGTTAHSVIADFAHLASVRAAAQYIASRYSALNVLINNVGIWTTRRQFSADGIELTWATNVLAHHVLTLALIEHLCKSRPARIINVASTFAGDLDLEDVEFTSRRWNGIAAYRQSKLALCIWTWALAQRLQHSGVTANAVHPGGVYTGIYRSPRGLPGAIIRLYARLTKASPREGADTPVWLATAQELEEISGRFWSGRREIDCAYRDADLGNRLWKLLERQAGRRQLGGGIHQSS